MLQEFKRFTKKRKAAILILIERGELTLSECMDKYNISKEELGEWCEAAKAKDYYENA